MSEEQPPITGDEMEAKLAAAQQMNFIANVCRSGLHSAAADILEQLEAADAPHRATAMMTGATMFAAEITHGTMSQLGGDMGRTRTWFIESCTAYFDKYVELALRERISAVKDDGPGVQ